jgi:hypothetical protein
MVGPPFARHGTQNAARQGDPVYLTLLAVANPVSDGWPFAVEQQSQEQAIKSFIIGRKAWLFSVTPTSARALANRYAPG